MSIAFDTGFSSGVLSGTTDEMVGGISRMNVAIDRARSRSAGSPDTASALPTCIHASTASARVARA